MDYTEELYNFSNKYKIKLIGEYANVKKNTPIYYSCSNCNIQVKKSYGTLTKYIDSPNVCIYKKFCDKCFRIMHY